MAADFKEKRKTPRIPYSSSVEITSGNVKHFALILNISVGGVGIESEEILSIEKNYIFEFVVEDDVRIKSKGEVKWGFKRDNTYVYGIEFNDLGLFTKMKLNKFINRKVNEK